jgi:hypothetical protein
MAAMKTHELYCPGCLSTLRHGTLRKDAAGRQHLCCPKESCRRILQSVEIVNPPVEVLSR